MASARRKRRFRLCVRNTGCDDLELRKLYERLPDKVATAEGYVRVIDESGDGLPLSGGYFVAVEVPRQAERALARRVPTTGSNWPMSQEVLWSTVTPRRFIPRPQ
jgi:hypothetical protein